MYQRGMKWETYLEFEGFKDDIIHGLQRQTSEAAATTHALNAGFGEMIASQQEMAAVMQNGFAAVSYGLERVSNGLESLRADFDWAMGAVLWKLELQHATLRNILATLQAPLDPQAKALRGRAENAYAQGWYDEALTDLLESEQKNYQDFAVHQTIGNVYLYHRQPADLDKARSYYLKAGKYATPRSAYHAAQAFIYAAFVCYQQRDDKAAIEHARRATELAPQLAEAYFNHAKFAAAAGQAAVAIPSLERTIRTDRNYAIKARADADFVNIEAAVSDLMERLRSEARQQAQAQCRALQTAISCYVIAPQEYAPIERAQSEIESLMKQDTYFGYLDALVKLSTCRKVFESLRLSERDRLRDQVTGALARLRTALAEYVVPDFFQARLNRELAEAERLLAQLTFASACAARDKVDTCEAQWKAMMAGGVERAVLTGHTDCVKAIAFSLDGATLASVSDGLSYGHHSVRLWDVATGRERTVLKGHTKSSCPIAFSPDGATLASGSDGLSYGHHSVWLRDVATAHIIRSELTAHTGKVTAIAFSSDGATLASGSVDHTVRLWDVATGRERAVLTGHTDCVEAIAFSPDGATLASGSDHSDDHPFRLWDVATGRERAVLWVEHAVRAIAFSLDGATLASGSDDHTVRLWALAIHKVEWERMERKRQEQKEERRQQQQRAWRAAGCCEICGEKLGFLDKAKGNARCKQHR